MFVYTASSSAVKDPLCYFLKSPQGKFTSGIPITHQKAKSEQDTSYDPQHRTNRLASRAMTSMGL